MLDRPATHDCHTNTQRPQRSGRGQLEDLQPRGPDLSDTQGQFFGGVPSTFALGTGQVPEILGVNQSTDNVFRSNFGLVETTGSTAGDAVRAENEVRRVIEHSIGWAIEKDFDKMLAIWAHDKELYHHWLSSASTTRGFDEFAAHAESWNLNRPFA